MQPTKSFTILMATLLVAPLFSGCLGLFDDEPSTDPAPSGSLVPTSTTNETNDPPVEPTTPATNQSKSTGTPGTNETTPPPTPPPPVPVRKRPTVILAHIDEGINPYHEQFRDTSDLAYVHPSKYIAGYPATVRAVNLSLNATTYDAARAADAGKWATVVEGELLWFPGTRIIGAISFNIPETGPFTEELGHGSMTAGRAAGRETSLAPEARIVTIQGLGGRSVEWAANQGWIDLQTNSWLSLIAPPANQNLRNVPGDAQSATPEEARWVYRDDTTRAFKNASGKHVVFAASGNGAAYFTGFAPTPTQLLSTAAPGVILVGAHDNGNVALWSGAPAHVVADGYGGPTVAATNMRDKTPTGVACCTSAAAPYAAGVAAAIILEARTILGDTGTGVRDGKLAVGAPGAILAGPLADGDLTMAEFREILLHTASIRPGEGPHDGIMHPTGRSDPPDPTNPGGNPYCQGCWTAPITYQELPEQFPVMALNGYGALDASSLGVARAVLRGVADAPARDTEDSFFATDAAVRAILFADVTELLS